LHGGGNVLSEESFSKFQICYAKYSLFEAAGRKESGFFQLGLRGFFLRQA
jgi:hypothetical protein